MYKKNSENLQSRAVRAVLFDTKAAGIDPETWKDMDAVTLELQREVLVSHKLRLQQQVAEIAAKIARAGQVARESNRYLPVHVFERMRTDRIKLMGQLHEIDQHAAQLKAVMREKRAKFSPQEDFHRVFYQCAKDMLAGPVFDRVRIAAHHRIGADQEEA